MADENKIKEELLKQAKTNAPFDPEAINQMLQKEERKVNRTKQMAITLWIMVAVWILGLFIFHISIRPSTDELTVSKAIMQIIMLVLTVTVHPLLILAIVFTILFYSRSRTLSIKQINARLAGIEEQLKKIAGT